MSAPTVRDEEKVRRLVRYLRGKPKGETLFRWQGDTPDITVYTDSDWANDARTRRSHSGGVILRGAHLLGHWCRIQSVVALSSAEAELYASVLGITRVLGVLHLGRSLWGEEWGTIRHCLDSSACKSIISRKGSGGIKHLSTKDLWVQEAVRRFGIVEQRVPRAENPSDSLASFSASATLQDHLERLGCRVYSLGPARRQSM